MIVRISPQGKLTFIYQEYLSLDSVGAASIRRGSHVEPDFNGRWLVDLSPVCGPTLGPFEWRSEAIQAETDWIETNRLSAEDLISLR